MLVAWQGFKIEVPDRWGPVKLEGNAEEGYMLMADLHRPRLGIRWKKEAGRRFKPDKTSEQAMLNEVGKLEAEKAVGYEMPSDTWDATLIYEDPEPPGRDIFVGYSTVSSRVFQVVYHAHRRERTLVEKILPNLIDEPESDTQDWAIFELSCRIPGGMQMVKQRLNAGDLGLEFRSNDKKTSVNVRQIAVAQLALRRRPMERWLLDQLKWRGKYFRTAEKPEVLDEALGMIGQRWRRKRRLFWMFWHPRGYYAIARHDQERDRIVIVDATSEELAQDVLQSIGWARYTQQTET